MSIETKNMTTHYQIPFAVFLLNKSYFQRKRAAHRLRKLCVIKNCCDDELDMQESSALACIGIQKCRKCVFKHNSRPKQLSNHRNH